MTDLVEFLAERYREARAREESKLTISAKLPFQWTHCYTADGEYVELGAGPRVPVDQFYGRYGEPAADPQVLADLDSKQAVVDHVARELDASDKPRWYDDKLLPILKALAFPFAGHPDYQEEWRP